MAIDHNPGASTISLSKSRVRTDRHSSQSSIGRPSTI